MQLLRTMRPYLTTALLAVSVVSRAQLTVAPQSNLQQLAANITGPGVTISNPVITCHSLGYGVFSYTGTQLGADEGVILTTGRITDAPGPNNNTGTSNWFAQNTAGDPVLNAVTGRTTMDACKFEFDIIPTGDSLSFNFVFASEEYNEWVGSQYNDVFGFFISGPGIVGDPNAGNDKNIALIPGTNQAVTINNVNNGSNSAYYHDNAGGSHIQYDGFTRNLVARTAVSACNSYHLKLVIADASDRKYDSGVFIQKIKSNNVTMQAFTQSGGPDMVEGCNPGWVRFTRPFPRPTPLNISYFIQGTATNGTDYSAINPTNPALAKTITIPANQTYVDRPVNPLSDALNENTESLTFILGNPFCPAQALDTLQFNIVDTLIATMTPGNRTICEGDSVQYTVTGGSSYSWSPTTGVSDPTSATTWVHPANTTTYAVTIMDGTCTRTISRTVRVSKLAISGTVTPPLCTTSSNGAINLTLSGGVAPYTYAWTGPNGFTASTQDITGLAPGTYTVTVTDAGCTRTASFNVVAPAALGVSITPSILPFGQNIACNGGSTGSIATVITGGTPSYTVNWSGPGGYTSNSASISGLSAGAYALTVTDVNGCTATANATLTQPTAMTASITGTTPVTCFGTNIGQATVGTSGGIPPYTYAWGTTPAQATPTATGLAAGSYAVTVTDGYGCTASATANVGGPTNALSASLVSRTNVLCHGNSTGSATINTTGGTAPHTISWNTTPAQSGAAATGLPAGTWTATVTDANNCSITFDVVITQPAAPLAASVFAQTNVGCFGAASGSATISASGGTGPYTYQWNTTPAQNTATANGLSAGSYTCTVRDVNNCQTVVNVTITQPAAALSTSITAQGNVSCFGGNNGSATIGVSGGTAPYSYSWNTSPVQSSASATDLGAGSWTCTVTDANGCTTTRTVTITQPVAVLSASTTAQTNVGCHGAATGSATVNASGGTAPYAYQWNTVPAQNTASANGLPAGSWTCTITDANGCTTTRTITITEPAADLGVSIGSVVDVLVCQGSGSHNGSAIASATGGTTPYSYAWNTTPVQSGASVSVASIGTYTVTVTDANGCTAQTDIAINLAPSATTAIGSTANVSCTGGDNGGATVISTGGGAITSITWNSTPQQTGATLVNVPAGSYTATVQHADGCVNTATAVIAEPAAVLSGSISAQTGVSCFGGNDGTATAQASGSTAPYSYQWNTVPVQNSAAAANLSAGSYACTITDANGCSTTVNASITQPAAALSTTLNSSTDVSCFGGTDGTAGITANGGTAPYTYSWNTVPVQSGASATGLAAGTWTCTVTDGKGCVTTGNVTIAQPAAALATSIGAQTNVACSSGTNGSATITATGGTAPYTYAWNTIPAQNNATANNLGAGTWTCTVTDGKGCTTSINVTITQPAMLTLSGATTAATCGGSSTGAIDATVTGGAGGYGFAWTGPSGFTAASEDISALASGVYTLTVTDANGCSTAQAFNVGQPGLFTVNGTTSSFTGGYAVSCATATNGSIAQTITGGTSPYTYIWTGPNGFTAATEDLSGLAAGTYTMVLTDANGCSTSATYTINAPAPLSAGLNAPVVIGGTNISCNGAGTGSIDATITGGTGPMIYAWTGPSGFTSGNEDISGLVAGAYTLTVSDVNGCSTNSAITLTQPAALNATASMTTAVGCFGGATGIANVNATGGTAPYSFSWNTAPAQNGANASGLIAGTYTVQVSDANGCATGTTVTITQPAAALSVGITAQTNVLIYGQSTGAATASASGGTSPYTYSWSTNPVQNTASATGLSAGTYTVTATDANGCSAASTVTITQPLSPLSAAITAQTNVGCFGASTGSATASGSGGTAPYTYQWNTAPAQGTATATGLSAGTWTCTITDANGAVTTTSVTITGPAAALAASIPDRTDVDCRGNSTGSATVGATGGTAPYTFGWNTVPAQSTAAAIGLSAGTWTCTVTDANGCSTTATATINEPAASLSAAITAQNAVGCFGGANGQATTAANGGTAPYAYSWNTSPVQGTATAVNLPAGTWTCAVTDANGCTTSVQATITQPAAALTVGVSNLQQATCGLSNGAAIATANGGTAPYGYAWSSTPVQNSATLTGVNAGTYTVTVTDANGCTTTGNTTITSPSSLGIAVVSTLDQTCFGSATGQATVAASGGIAPYSYSWNTVPVQNSATAVGLQNGSYTATVTDASGCTAQVAVAINGPAAALAISTVSITPVLCNGASTGGATVGATGGTAPYAFVWYTTPQVNGSTLSNVGAGSYTAVVTDANGCIASTNVNVPQPAAPLSAYVESYANVSCYGLSDGWAQIDVVGGSGSYTITWNTVPAQSGLLATGLGTGTYTVTVTDNNGCNIPKSYPVTIGGPTAPVAVSALISSINGLPISCPGGEDGSIDITITGGTAPYFHTWTDDLGGVSGSEDLNNLGAGTYHLTVSDANGCSLQQDFTLIDPAPISATANVTTTTCQGAPTGAIDASVNGGTAPYTVNWTGPNGYTGSGEDITGLAAGVYTMLITDAHGCTATALFDVTEPGLLNLTGTTSSFTGGANVSCDAATDGAIDITIAGGTVPYSYLWNGPNGFNASAEDLTGLGAGNYAVTVTDANGCATLASFVLSAPDPLTLSLQASTYNGTAISCAGANDGSVNATVAGGTPSIVFAWSGPNGFSAGTEDIAGLEEGSYTLVATDVNGCSATASIDLIAPLPLTATAASPTYNSGSNVSCDGAATGSINLGISGGTASYSVVWSGPNGFTSTDASPSALEAGTYTATITDANGCTSGATITLSAPAPTTLSGTVALLPNGQNISCAGGNDGSIDLTTSGGAGNASYQWSGPAGFTATTEDITGLEAGVYTVSTIDQNGCIASAQFTLTAPQPLQATSTTVSTTCFGSNTGSIDLSVSGGTAPYGYLWAGPGAFSATTEDIQSLYAGGYIATITDASGCTTVHGATVTEPSTFTITAAQHIYPGGFNVSCAGESDGAIDATVQGGTAPYFYQWSGPNGFLAIIEDVNGLAAGNYILVVNDQNGCGTLVNYTVTEATPLTAGLLAQVFAGGANTGCADSQDGLVDAIVAGGIQPYSYSWTGPNGFTAGTEDIVGLEPGTFALNVVDAVGCSTSDTITLVPAVPVAASATPTVLGNGANVSCASSADGSIDLAVTGGAQPYTVIWTGPNGFASGQADISGLAAGTYTAAITDVNGCTSSASATLNAPDTLGVGLTASLFGNGYNLPCMGANSGTLSASVTGGSGGFTYAWSGPSGFTSSSPNLAGLAAGTYTLLVTDAAGCTASASFTLTQPTDMSLASTLSDAGSGYAVSCTGNDGAIDVNVSGGTAPYVFDWTGSNGFAALNEDLTGLAEGTYTLNVIDANGCTLGQTFILERPVTLLTATAVTGTICNNAVDGAIDLTVTGGVTPYTFAWTGPNGFNAGTEDIANLAGGTYSVVVTDAMNCTASATDSVRASSSIDLAVYTSQYNSVNIPCQGDSSGVIELSVAGGAGSLAIDWSGPNGFQSNDADLYGLVAGTYTALITDVNGCTADTTVTLTEPTGTLNASLLAALFPSGTNVSCNGASDGSIDATITGGTGPYTFDWRGPDSTSFATEDLSGVVAGLYELVVTDVNQCSYTTTITLTEPDSALQLSVSLSSYAGGYATSCSGSSDATIAATAAGGNGAYSLVWSGPNGFTATGDSLQGLAAGDYIATVTDLNGCSLTDTIPVLAPDPLTAQITPTLFPGGSMISCADADDGTLTIGLNGGVPGFDVQWTGPNGATASGLSITGLAAGTWCATVTDTNGCTTQACFDLLAPAPIQLTATSTDATCGASNGGIDLEVSGGSGAYAYAWTGGAQTQDLQGAAAGDHSVTVTDANGCTADTTLTITGTNSLLGELNTTTLLCADANDASIDLTLLNGTAPFTYAWSDGSTTEDLNGLGEGSYTVNVSDANGCTWSDSTLIVGPAPLVVDTQVYVYPNGTNVSASGASNGHITLSVSGGTPPYAYQWSNGATTAQVNGLAAGTYTATVTDANGCSVQLSFTLSEPDDLAMPTGFSPNGDGSNDTYVIHGIEAYPNNQFIVFNRWGNVVYEQLNYRNAWAGENTEGERLPDGTYFIILRLNEGAMTMQNYVDLRR